MYLNEYLALELLRGRKTASLDLHWGSVQALCRQQEHIHTYITHSEDKGHTTHTDRRHHRSLLDALHIITYHHTGQDHELLATNFTALTSPTSHMPLN